MSSHLNILLDTNIIISLNDLEYPLDPRLAEMQRLLDQLSFHVFVHPAQKDDLIGIQMQTAAGVTYRDWINIMF